MVLGFEVKRMLLADVAQRLVVLLAAGQQVGVGGLTLIFATLSANKNTLSKLPLEKITVG